jgi:hypothetical protein
VKGKHVDACPYSGARMHNQSYVQSKTGNGMRFCSNQTCILIKECKNTEEKTFSNYLLKTESEILSL